MKIFLKFFLKRLAAVPLTLFIITIIMYAIVMIMPIEARIDLYMPKTGSMIEGAQERTREKIIETYHLLEPFPTQYFFWVRNLAKGDWGYSPLIESKVLPALKARLPVTLELIFFALIIQIPLGLLAGVWSARRKNSPVDAATRMVAFVATAFPDFILAIILLSIFYISLHWFPPERLSITNHLFIQTPQFKTITGFLSIDGFLNKRGDISLDALRHLLLPVFTLSFTHWATLARITRTHLLEELDKEYILAAHSRGIKERSVIWKHAFRNILGPTLNSSALSAAALVTSAFVVEKIFNLKGISDLITRYGPLVPDSAAVLGFGITSTILVLGIMFVLDILQAMLLPQFKEEIDPNESV
jgi:peptide/nickel transport system permease protein